jgi:DNA-directed RNA polymerase specialized sigma24 family protein
MPADHSNHRQSTHSFRPLPRPSERSSSPELHQVITPAELREAERTLKGMLGAKVPRLWITQHAQEALGQALIEYLEWMATNGPARNPTGWLCTCAYRRTLNLGDSERRRPRLDPLDTVFHLPDERTPTPEQEAIDHDRQERLRKAMSHLPEKEVKLVALVYYGNNSIREAGQKLGWEKSAAARHHDTAMDL